MSSAEECAALSGCTGAYAMGLTALLSLFAAGFSDSMLEGVMRSVMLFSCGFVCLHGSIPYFAWGLHESIQENCGFALGPLGRGCAYLLAGFHCIGVRGAAVAEETALGKASSSPFGFVWYLCCLMMLAGGAASLWAWHGHRRSVLLSSDGEADNYYISA
mmetsp:Transcript_11073/g.24691  ORF Transcript_11073/g.24691 Transcript_11073/m.24691 type:complete len:160 (-) Transcript_11073:29-508(-)